MQDGFSFKAKSMRPLPAFGSGDELMEHGEDLSQDAVEKIREKIWARFREVAVEQASPFPIGPDSAKTVGYPKELVDSFTLSVTESFAGVGYPFSLGPLQPGEKVLDVGCGSGLDALIAAYFVGPEGCVVGVDMVPDMVQKARDNVVAYEAEQVHILMALAEDLPLADGSFDVVVSNGVINLLPVKFPLLTEIHRVLKPQGRLMVADMILEKPLAPEAREDPDLWSQ
jgi:SAM-dependent methyltransferase